MNPTVINEGIPLYSRTDGRRVAPHRSRRPAADEQIAVVVLDDGRAHSINGDVVLGRLPSEDRRVRAASASPIVVPDVDRRVSRSHLLIRIDGWRVEAIDLGSRNGSWIMGEDGNWRRLVPGIAAPLEDGATLCLGSRHVRVRTLHHGTEKRF